MLSTGLPPSNAIAGPKMPALGTDGVRAQMAAAILREHASDRFEACCAATKPKVVDSRTVNALRQHGIDAASVCLYPLPSMRGESYVFFLDSAVQLPEHLAAQARDWEMPDPLAADTLAAFEQARDLIESTLFDWLTQFEERDEAEAEGPPAHHLGEREVLGGQRTG
jgi:protein-tyrosine-phosphatase